MNGDIVPPRGRSANGMPTKRPLGVVAPTPRPQASVPGQVQSLQSPDLLPVPPAIPPADQPPASLRRSKKKVLWIVIGTILALLVAIAVGSYFWYQSNLQPVTATNTKQVELKVIAGASTQEVAKLLADKHLIRSELAFVVYVRLSGAHSQIKSGTYAIAPSESVQQIATHLMSGKSDVFRITFYPGATLEDYTTNKQIKKTDVRTMLRRAGYSDSEITAAFKKKYDHPLFDGRPAGADIEGYVYGETYEFERDATVEQVLARTFDEFYATIKENDLVDGFKKHGFNLYQGITLASIIQREVISADDQKQVAQVFLKRFGEEVALGSDVTYQYAAKKLGVAPSPDLASPYNTRRYAGLPPGPIAVPGLSALVAVANPASGDYHYFLSGDDGTTYFARTVDEHEANIRDHCQVNCSTL